jgi:hypothetical protein
VFRLDFLALQDASFFCLLKMQRDNIRMKWKTSRIKAERGKKGIMHTYDRGSTNGMPFVQAYSAVSEPRSLVSDPSSIWGGSDLSRLRDSNPWI